MAGWNSLSTRQKVALALGVSAGAAVLCICYAKYRSGRAQASPGSAEDGYELRLKIPQDAVKRLLAGADDVIGQFAQRTAAHIELSQVTDSEGRRELTIRGRPSQVQRAQELLSGVLGDDVLLQVALHLPARSMCRIIGQGGQRIRDICKSSGARIHCERQPEDSSDLAKCITITGSREQVEAAKSLIQKAMAEDVSKTAAASSNFRAHRKNIIAVRKKDRQPPSEESITPNTDRSPDSFYTADSPEERPAEDAEPRIIADNTYNICKFEVPSPDFNFHADEYVDVYVSASESPQHFWIQILGSRFSQLDKLTTEMSEFYVRQKRGETPEFQVGDIVAAPFHDDGFWYRAEVLGHLEDGSVDLYYGDYGDNWVCPKENLFPLRSDFLSLAFQAVECGLANVAPNGGKWTSAAVDAFDTLAFCAKWRQMLAKIARFPSPGVSHFQIQLYDPSRDPRLDIGQELIRLGHAVKHRTSPVKSDDEMMVSRLLEEVTSLSKKPEPPGITGNQEEKHLSDESVELLRADVDHSPGLQPAGTPPPQLETSTGTDNLEQSMSKICLSASDQSGTADSSASSSTTSQSSDSSSSSSSGQSSSVDSSSGTSSDLSTCTASEGPSLLSSSLEDSSIYSPRGCFYYPTDEVSTSSIFTSSKEIITISSDSEEESATFQEGARRASANPDVMLNSSSNDVIVVEDNDS